MLSMSETRTHFWVVVARGTERGAWPRKMGLNCSMPAMVSSTVGSDGMRDAPAAGPATQCQALCTIPWACESLPSNWRATTEAWLVSELSVIVNSNSPNKDKAITLQAGVALAFIIGQEFLAYLAARESRWQRLCCIILARCWCCLCTPPNP